MSVRIGCEGDSDYINTSRVTYSKSSLVAERGLSSSEVVQLTTKFVALYSQTMKSFLAGFLGLVVIGLLAVSVSSQRVSTCENTFCPYGRMCVPLTGGGTICQCPETCPDTYEPVCSVYGKQFDNMCQLHKFACALGVNVGVKNRGACTEDNLNPRVAGCDDYQLLQFPYRFLDWLMIARELTLNPKFRLGRRAEKLREDEVRDITLWEFENLDKDKNRELDDNEIKRIENRLLPLESCIHGFLKSCDLDGVDGISPREWSTCFPKGVKGEGVGSRKH